MNLLRDAKFGLKLLLKDKYVSLAGLVTLAFCIGGNATIFTILNTLIMRPLPFENPDRIVEIYNTYPKLEGGNKSSSNVPIFLDFSSNTDAFTDLALVGGFAANFGQEGSPERIRGQRVTTRFFNVIGVNPVVGSFFNDEHMIQGQHRAVVLAYSFWNNKYRADPDISNQTMLLNGQPYEIRGVAPRSLEVLYPNAQVFAAYAWNPDQVDNMSRHGNNSRLLARLKPNASVALAKAQIDQVDRVFYESNPSYQDYLDRVGHETQVNSLQEERVRNVASKIYMLQVGALLVLAIGCVNIANLLLIRSNNRQSEFAIRCAIGAKPLSIGRQLLVESVMLSIGGSLLGALLAWLGIELINTYAMDMLPPMQPLALDLQTILFALGLAIATGLIVGLFPLARVFTLNIIPALNHTSRGSSASRASQLTTSTLVCGQISLALVLLAGAGLLIHSFSKILARDLGFEHQNVMTLRISLGGQDYQEQERVHAFQNRLLDTIRNMPGVLEVGLSANVPMTTGYPYHTFRIFGYEMSAGEGQISAQHTWVSPGYFEALDIKILQGRGFNFGDTPNARRQLVIDKTLAERYYPGENPIGRRLGFVGRDTPEEDWPTVVGVVEVVQHSRIDGNVQGAPFIYENIYRGSFRSFSALIKTERSYEALMPMIRERLKEMDPHLPLFLSGSLSEFVDDSLNNRRALMFLLIVFAGIAVALSSVGIYGVLAYSVAQQSREIGTRAAIGANRKQILNHFLKRGFTRTAIGIGLGLIGALALSRLMTSMLYDVQPTDMKVYAIISLILFAISMLASYLPALKASRIHPMEALRLD